MWVGFRNSSVQEISKNGLSKERNLFCQTVGFFLNSSMLKASLNKECKMHTSQTTVCFEEPGDFYKNQVNSFKNYWILYITFKNFGVHTFHVYLNFLWSYRNHMSILNRYLQSFSLTILFWLLLVPELQKQPGGVL